MGLPSSNELTERLAWSKQQVDQVLAQCESWRNQALLAQSKVRMLESQVRELQQKLSKSLPLYDPDEYVSGGKG